MNRRVCLSPPTPKSLTIFSINREEFTSMTSPVKQATMAIN
jgi:hypothetical protein